MERLGQIERVQGDREEGWGLRRMGAQRGRKQSCKVQMGKDNPLRRHLHDEVGV